MYRKPERQIGERGLPVPKPQKRTHHSSPCLKGRGLLAWGVINILLLFMCIRWLEDSTDGQMRQESQLLWVSVTDAQALHPSYRRPVTHGEGEALLAMAEEYPAHLALRCPVLPL